jgi:DNA (cytosine-5)-methyltransferase 1
VNSKGPRFSSTSIDKELSLCYYRKVHGLSIQLDRPKQRARGRDNLEPVSRPIVIDLYAGAGGLSLGATRAGFHVAAAVEKDVRALQAHSKNFPATQHVDVEIDNLFSGRQLLDAAGVEDGSLAGLIGGPPCQGFSHIGRRDALDERNDLFVQFFRLVSETRPLFYLAENVPGILDDRHKETRLAARDYVGRDYVNLPVFKAFASDYGAPTSRCRAFFVGYRRGSLDGPSVTDFLPPLGIEAVNVKQALLGLPKKVDVTLPAMNGGWRRLERTRHVRRQFAERLWGHIPPGVGDQTAILRLKENREVSGCVGTHHRPDVIERFDALSPGREDSISRASRLDLKGFCPTIRAGTGSDKGSYQALRPIHPSEPRVITPREAARLQGFPDWFVFHQTKWHSFRQIGNSVSPILAEQLLKVIAAQLANHRQGRQNSISK